MKIRAVIYARCSTEEESQKDALVKQVAEAKECVSRQGWLLVDSYVESRSGTSTKGRTEYNRLYEELLTDKFDVIVIKSQDRLMRNTKDWYLFIDRLITSMKKLYIYIERKFFSSDDSIITGVKAILAEEYSRELSKKINNAHHNRQKTGRAVILTPNTYGYCKRPDQTVTLIEKEAEVKKRMYQLCAVGYGCRTVAAILQKDGVRNRKGKPFSDSDILRMIRNPINKGTVVMNKVHYDFDSKRTLKVPKEQQYVYENRIPAIVSEELWEAANHAIDQRAKAGNRNGIYIRNSSPGKYPLSGKIYCGLCNEPYYRTVRRSYRDKQKIFEWKCKRYLQEGRSSQSGSARPKIRHVQTEGLPGCGNIHIKEEVLYQLLEQICVNRYQPDKEKIIKKMVGMLKLVLNERDLQSDIDKEEKIMQQIKSQMNLLVDKLLEGILTDEMYQIKQKELEKKLNDAQERLLRLEKQNTSGSVLKDRIASIEKALQDGELIQKATTAGMIDEIDKIIIYPQYMELVLDVGKLLGIAQTDLLSGEKEKRLRVDFGNQFQYLEQKRESREVIVEMMRENPKITAKEIAKKLGISLSGSNYRIKALRKEGRIRFNGKGGKGAWEVLKE